MRAVQGLRHHDGRGLGGWVLLEVITALFVVAVLTGTFSELWVAGMRNGQVLLEKLSRERARINATYYVYHAAARGETIQSIADEVSVRYPEVEAVVRGGVLSVDGEQLYPVGEGIR